MRESAGGVDRFEGLAEVVGEGAGGGDGVGAAINDSITGSIVLVSALRNPSPVSVSKYSVLTS